MDCMYVCMNIFIHAYMQAKKEQKVCILFLCVFIGMYTYMPNNQDMPKVHQFVYIYENIHEAFKHNVHTCIQAGQEGEGLCSICMCMYWMYTY